MHSNRFSAANAHFCRITEPSGRGRIQETTSPIGDGNCKQINGADIVINIGNYFPDRGRKHLLLVATLFFYSSIQETTSPTGDGNPQRIPQAGVCLYRKLLPRQGTETFLSTTRQGRFYRDIGNYFPDRGRKPCTPTNRMSAVFSKYRKLRPRQGTETKHSLCNTVHTLYRKLLPRQGTETSCA